MIMYSSIFAAITLFPLALFYWQWPNESDYIIILMLAINSNVLLYCMLKAFEIAKASSLAPLRYFEIFFASMMGLLFFSEIPSMSLVVGAIIIIIANTFLKSE